MTDQEYVLCMWKERLWPAKVLCKTGVAGKTSVTNAKKSSFKVEILGLEEQICVKRADTVPLQEECIENIASTLDQRSNSREAVEELKYRHSLKIALDILKQRVSPRQVPSSEEGPNTQLSQENNAGSLPSTPLRRCPSLFHAKEKLEPSSKKKREQKNNRSLKTDTKNQTWKASFIVEESAKEYESGTNPSKCSGGDLYNTSNSDSQNCKIPESKSLPRQKKVKPELLTKSKPGNEASLKPKEGKRKEGRKRARGAGSPVSCGNDFPQDQAQPRAEEGSPLSVPCKSDAVVPVRRANARSQPRGTLLDSSCERASDDLEKRLGSESESLGKQLDGRKKPVNSRRVKGGQEIDATVSSCRKRKRRNCPKSSPGPSDHGTISDSFPSQRKEEENKNTSLVVMNTVKDFQLLDFEEGEGLESFDVSSELVSSDSLARLSALIDEEEEEEELPSILSHQEPQTIEEGILVWCKLRGYPYWPAVVKKVKRKHRKACVLLIEKSTNDKKKGFSVSLKKLKHFDCEEKQDLIERAKENYRQEIEWCIRLICDYRIRLGCHSFAGSFLEYFAADISYPVRKEAYKSSAQSTLPNKAEGAVEVSSLGISPRKPPRKLLPDRTRAARDRANKKIVDFIVKNKGAEEHLLAILKSRKQSRWLKGFLNSRRYMTCIETYLEDEEQLDLVVNYLKEVYCETNAKNLHQMSGDGIKFISDVLLPEAIIYAISAVDDIDYKKAEEKYIRGPSLSKRERELFDEEILERKRWKPS